MILGEVISIEAEITRIVPAVALCEEVYRAQIYIALYDSVICTHRIVVVINESNDVDRQVHVSGDVDGRASDVDALHTSSGTILSASEMRVNHISGSGVCVGVGVLCVLECCVCWSDVCVGVMCVLE